MQTGPYTFRIHLDTTPDEAEARVREALQEQGFGILTEIDVEATLREKIGEEIAPYRILGACNPPLAHRAISADDDIGALLPCNVVIRAANGGTDIVAADPKAMLALSESDALDEIAEEAKQRLEAALTTLE